MKENKICLIGGSGRSGTTILSRVFAKHPLISDVPELRFLIDPDGIIDFYTTFQAWSPYHFDLKLKRLKNLLQSVTYSHPLNKPFFLLQKTGILQMLPWNIRPRYANICATGFCPKFPKIVNELIERLTTFRYSGYWEGMNAIQQKEFFYNSFHEKSELTKILRDFLQQVIVCILEYQRVSYYLEKNTWNILWFDKILELIPDSRLVHIYRDPRDVVTSFTRQTWMPSDPLKSALIYRDIIQHWWDIKVKIPNHTYIEISLESLVNDTESILRKICTFWDLPWHESLLSIDLSKSHSGRWKKDLNTQEQNGVQYLLGRQIETFGYE